MADVAAYSVWVPTLMLVIFRVGGIFVTAPLLSNPTVPARVKAMMSVVIGLAVTARMSSPVAMPNSWTAVALGVGGEMVIGGTIGYAASLVFMGIALGGQQIGQQMGIALANVFNPLAQATTNVVSNTLQLTGIAIFLAIGGHRLMLQGLLETFGTVPLMGFAANQGMLDVIVGLLTAAMILGLKVAAPLLVAMMLASVAMGLIQRTMPQFNILSAGFQIRLLVGAVIVAASVAAMVPLIEIGWDYTMAQVARMFSTPIGP